MVCPGWEVERVSLQSSALAGTDVFQCGYGLDFRFSRTVSGTWKNYQGVTGTWELDFFIFEFIVLALRKEIMTEQALPPALLLRIWRPEFLPDPRSIPSAYRSGTWNFAHGDSCHLITEEDNHSSGPL
uniref:Uncharacterized protein n=1 Tax=Catagonus wagneri TaxID=51154 RepID=A0A8C3WAY2_9CETA